MIFVIKNNIRINIKIIIRNNIEFISSYKFAMSMVLIVVSETLLFFVM